jgi:hypothetical protein
LIDYANTGDQFEKVFSNISEAILYYPYWNRDSHFFDSYCFSCGTIRYYDIPRDYYLVKKDCYNLLFCKDCFEEIETQHMKRGIIFDTEYYCYEEIIKEYENPELEQ